MKSTRFKAYSNILKNNFSNLLRIRTYPRFAHFFITWRCNLRCRECNNWQKDETSELDTASLLRIIDQLNFLDVIKITGGEPFIRDDIVGIITEIRSKINPYIIQITTNGTYTERIIETVKQVHFPGLSLRISLDGMNDIHDKIRGVDGCYEKVQETILALIDLKKKRSFHLGINYGLRDETMPFLEEIFGICIKHNIGLIMGYPIKPFLENADFSSRRNVMAIEDNVLKKYKRFMYLQKPRRKPVESFVSNFLNKTFLKHESADRIQFDCGELRDLMYILPNGDLVTCGLRQQKISNLLEETFKDIWFSKGMEKHCRQIQNCSGCMQKSIKLGSKIYKFL
ncbi:MAG: radical SAM protein [Candidatus Saelkia tenebricola]|nr:radical SAM protein [Candidatus Saelkia tenebricola]